MLARADGERALPRLGGMARAGGVVIVSERFWAMAHTDGSLTEGELPPAHVRLRRIPLLRGLAKLSAAITPLARGEGVASRRERLFLLGVVLAPVLLWFAPFSVSTGVGIAVTIGMLVWLLRGRTLHLHGAEHRAIAAVEERRLGQTWRGEARPSRFAPRCGTNFAALVLPVALLANELWILPTAMLTPLAVTPVALALTMELWQVVQGSRRRAARALLLPGLALQRLTTREPRLDETRLALVAVAAVLERELGEELAARSR
jgi:uncharacterized protein YqhQ